MGRGGFRGVDAPEAQALVRLFRRVGQDGVAVDDPLDLEGYLRRAGDPVFGVALVDVQEACDGVFRVVAQFFGHVWLELRVYGGRRFVAADGVMEQVDAGDHGEVEERDGDDDGSEADGLA